MISGTGDRRDEDIKEIGRISARMFNDIIICQEKYLRDRTAEEIVNLIVEGIIDVKPEASYKIILSSDEAWNYVINKVKPGELITIISDSIDHSYDRVKRYLDGEAANSLKSSIFKDFSSD